MVPSIYEQESLVQNPIFDSLLCEEERFDECEGGGLGVGQMGIEDFSEIRKDPFAFLMLEHDLVWEEEELAGLFDKERKQTRLSSDRIRSDGWLNVVRNEAIKWMLRVIGYYGFNAMTALLAVDYYDRFVTSSCFQKDKPWMSQLAAVACLSIAAKMEETQVPMLLDFQLDLFQHEESKYLFEAKTIQRMELLVLSTLQWKMNPVTPISFLDHIVRRFKLITGLHWHFLRRCESIILAVITDCRFVHNLPSVIAAATIVYVVGEMENCDAIEFQNELISVLGASKEDIDDCYKIIMETMDSMKPRACLKRKLDSIPSSPNDVMDVYFSSESSLDSWAVASPLTTSPKPLFKRSRVRDQPMRLTPLPIQRG